MEPSKQPEREIVPVEAKPVETSKTSARPLPPIVAKTVNLCVNCVQGAGRMVRDPLRRRYHRHYHARHRFGRHHLAADLMFVAGIMVLLGVNAWLLLGKPPIFPSKVRLSWEVPSVLRIGDAATFSLHFTYNGDAPLDRSTIALQVPATFRVDRVDPGTYDAATRTLTLPGVLAPGASGTATVSGVVAAAGERDVLDLHATFHGTGESRAERTNARTSVPIAGVAIAFELTGPSLVPANGVAGFVLQYRSEATLPLERIAIRPTPRTPLTLAGDDPWGNPRTIAPGEQGRLVFEIRTKDAGTFPLDASVMSMRSDGPSVVLDTFTSPLDVRVVPVQFGIASQGDGPAIARLGETVEIGASYTGQHGAALPEGFARAFAVRVRGPLATSARVEAKDASVVTREYIRWSFVPVPTGEIAGRTFTVTLPTTVDSTRFTADTKFSTTFTPMLWLSGEGERGDGTDGFPLAYVEGAPFTLDVAGELRVHAYARYFTPEGDQLGRGPLPPRVGATTKYMVAWDMRSVLHDAGAVVVRATLPPGVEWVGRAVSTVSSAPQFDAASRTITWRIERLERAIGSQIPAASASFEVALIPNAAQVGSFAPLLEETSVTAIGVSDIAVQATAPAVTTELPLDQRVKGKGRVVAQ
ncbi:MAG: hypothetical protein Q7S02_02345 [bacterium]|nr:hypothetical protein [bacterium]